MRISDWSSDVCSSDLYDRSGKCPIRVGRLRSYFSPVLPILEDITVKEIQNVSASEPMIDVVAMNAMGNLLKNPVFVDGTAGWAIPAGANATLVPGNKAVAGAGILRLTLDSAMVGVFYVSTEEQSVGKEWLSKGRIMWLQK